MRGLSAGCCGEHHHVHLIDDVLPYSSCPTNTQFDENQAPELFHVPRAYCPMVPLFHPNPRYKWFSDLGLRWYAIPAGERRAAGRQGFLQKIMGGDTKTAFMLKRQPGCFAKAICPPSVPLQHARTLQTPNQCPASR